VTVAVWKFTIWRKFGHWFFISDTGSHSNSSGTSKTALCVHPSTNSRRSRNRVLAGVLAYAEVPVNQEATEKGKRVSLSSKIVFSKIDGYLTEVVSSSRSAAE